MTLPELVERQRAFRRGEHWMTAALLTTLFGGMLVAVFVKGGRLYLLGLFLVLGLEFVAFGLLWMRSLSGYGLRCPSCRRPLTGLPGQITVATGRCGNCGTTIWSDEAR